jgi:hypothetical protein
VRAFHLGCCCKRGQETDNDDQQEFHPEFPEEELAQGECAQGQIAIQATGEVPCEAHDPEPLSHRIADKAHDEDSDPNLHPEPGGSDAFAHAQAHDHLETKAYHHFPGNSCTQERTRCDPHQDRHANETETDPGSAPASETRPRGVCD